ncbi:MAG: endonuclease/exonuclease/phosphatase family protein [Pseudomonadota bacterium]
MRIATYNVEWFASLFDDEDQLIFDQSWSGRSDVTKSQQLGALARVFRAVDADAYMIIEAPNTGRKQNTIQALQNFAQHFGLRQTTALSGFTNQTQQEIALLFDPDQMNAIHAPLGQETDSKGLAKNARFDGAFRLDVDVDARPDAIVFSKPPLEVTLTPHSGGTLSLIGVHAKSKAPHGAKDDADAMRIAIQNRRKQLAQCIWIRQRVDQLLDQDKDIVVLGDFNDGPGLDTYEQLFGQSSIEIVLAQDQGFARTLFDPHASMALSPWNFVMPTTARFYKYETKSYLNALLDYIMVSHRLRSRGSWQIWHPFNHAPCFEDNALCQALLTASDHFPVSIDLELG